MQQLASWLFRNRQTGAITVVQTPNLPLIVWLVAAGANRLAKPAGTTGTVLTVASRVALIVWAGDEILRGVNPWRRGLGAAVLVAVLADLRT